MTAVGYAFLGGHEATANVLIAKDHNILYDQPFFTAREQKLERERLIAEKRIKEMKERAERERESSR